jgi:hypothetical protein
MRDRRESDRRERGKRERKMDGDCRVEKIIG